MNKIIRSCLAMFLFGLCLFLQMNKGWAKDIELKLENGLTVLATLSMAEGKSLKDDGVILFLHGTLAHKGMSIITNEQALLNERGFNVLNINLSLGRDRRTGMYDCNIPHTHKHKDALAELDQWLVWLKEQEAASVVMMGHSRGGNQVAWYNAEVKNPLVKKIVLIAPQTWRAQKESVAYKERFQKDLAPILDKMVEKTVQGKGDEIVKEIDFIYCSNADVTPAAFVDYYRADERMNTPSLLGRISQPILIIAGSQDQVVKDLPEQMGGIDLDNVHFNVIEEADHMFIDFAGEDLADQVTEFLQAP